MIFFFIIIILFTLLIYLLFKLLLYVCMYISVCIFLSMCVCIFLFFLQQFKLSPLIVQFYPNVINVFNSMFSSLSSSSSPYLLSFSLQCLNSHLSSPSDGLEHVPGAGLGGGEAMQGWGLQGRGGVLRGGHPDWHR